ncbi:MAG: aromatic ring-hydroxylating dioxygenase subunit alpha, partial [Salinirussus sp.]
MAEADSRTAQFLSRIGDDLLEAKFPLRAYNDPAIFDLEMDRLFGTHWIFIGHESEVAEPGDYVRRDIGTDPFILVRDEAGNLDVFFNSCPHRGTQFCKSEYGNTSHFRCPYHGWTFDNSGDLVGVPHRDKAYPGDELPDLGLVSAPKVDTYRGLVFACLDENAPSLKDYLGDATWYLDLHFGLIDMEVHGQPQRWELDVDWKNAVDNEVGDSYHADYGHKSAKDVGVGSSAIGANSLDFSRRHVYDCDRSTHNFSITAADEDVFWDHPPEVVETFDFDAVSEAQLGLARRT